LASLTAALALCGPGTAPMPGGHGDRLRAAEASGARAVAMIEEGLTPDKIVTPKSIENGLRVLLAIGGSTNAIVHLTAIAGRMGIEISLDRLNVISDETPVLIDLKPTGEHYMEDLFFGGGVGAVLRELKPLLHLDCMTVAGETLGERLEREDGAWADPAVVRPISKPMRENGGLVALFGNLAPNGAILKRSAADPTLFESEGRAVVFSSLEDMAARVDSPDLDVEPGDFLVLQNAGPKAIGMPEAGYLPIPAKLARQGIKDMVRISDARMSGTAFGTIVLHISPEAAVGGPLALVRNGDRIRLSVERRRIELLVDDAELIKRKRSWQPFTAIDNRRGYGKLYFDHVMQAEDGCDFDFLRAVK
jgi:dihydroxy-acid dehydratase